MKKKPIIIVKLLLISMCLFVLAPIYAQDIRISTQDDTVTFPFYFNALEQVTISIIATDPTVFDPYVELSIGGIRVAENDNNDQFHLNNAEELSPTDAQIILFSIPTTGQYDVTVSGVGASRNHFRILVETMYGSGFSPGTVSPSSKAILYSTYQDGSTSTDIFSLDLGSTPEIIQLSSSGTDSHPNLSPDGTQVLFSRDFDNEFYSGEIYVMNIDGSSIRQLTFLNAVSTRPKWSPDGSMILFRSWPIGGGVQFLYIMNKDGSNLRQIRPVQSADWSPDGSQIIFSNAKNGVFDIFMMNFDGTNEVNITTGRIPSGEHSNPSISPDGSRIVFNSNFGGNFDIYTMNLDGSALLQLTQDPSMDLMPFWSFDGSQIVFSSQRNGNFDVYTMNADGSNLSQLTWDIVNEVAYSW